MKTNNSGMIDTHSHLSLDQFEEDREQVIDKCKEKLSAVIVSGADLESNRQVLKLSRRHSDFLFPTLALDPTKPSHNLNKFKQQVQAHSEEMVGLGEIGLDYHHVQEKEERKEQREKFQKLLEFAQSRDEPVVIHSRDAEKDVLRLLEKINIEQAVLHCFNGTIEQAKEGCSMGYYVSISTQVLYSKRVKELAENLPLNKILLETDSPFLYREERNVPWNIKESLEKIADLREESKEEIREQIFENTLEVFPDLEL